MKKIFTLAATALCAMGINAQGYQYVLTDADEALTQELINTVAENAGGTSAEIVILVQKVLSKSMARAIQERKPV